VLRNLLRTVARISAHTIGYEVLLTRCAAVRIAWRHVLIVPARRAAPLPWRNMRGPIWNAGAGPSWTFGRLPMHSEGDACNGDRIVRRSRRLRHDRSCLACNNRAIREDRVQ
jgi:hypothetical protein